MASTGRRRVNFAYEDADAQDVSVCGSFNDWQPGATPLKRSGNGSWKAQVLLAPGRYQYRYYVDGEWRDDPQATAQVPNEHGSVNAVREVA